MKPPLMRKIFALLKDVGKTNEWLHDMLPEWVAKSSLKDVTDIEAQEIIRSLENVKNIRPFVKGTRTDKQKRTILWLASKLNFKDDHLPNFIQYTTGNKRGVDDLTIGEASAVITGLKNNILYKQSTNIKQKLKLQTDERKI